MDCKSLSHNSEKSCKDETTWHISVNVTVMLNGIVEIQGMGWFHVDWYSVRSLHGNEWAVFITTQISCADKQLSALGFSRFSIFSATLI
jgi:hypothetical protein